MASITLKEIEKTYPGDVTAVKDVNLKIEDKQFVVLVGPSGCGKSTTLRMIAGLEEITGGELYIGDRLVNDIAPKDRDIAMVFQNYALYPHMTVFQNMAFGLQTRRTPKKVIDESVREAARVLEIEHLLTRKPKALSGGERQRVALGRAMVRKPVAFLLDEPLSNLDAKLRESMRVELIKLHKKLGTTFVYVTHDQTEAMTMGDVIVVMHKGVVQQVDTPQNLYEKPCNKFVGGFIGTPKMNFLDGTLKREGDLYYVDMHGGMVRLDLERINKDLSGYVDKEVILGIRPEDLSIDEVFLEENPDFAIPALVEVRELLGREMLLYLDFVGERLAALMTPRQVPQADSEINVGLNMRRAFLFDAETEATIMG